MSSDEDEGEKMHISTALPKTSNVEVWMVSDSDDEATEVPSPERTSRPLQMSGGSNGMAASAEVTRRFLDRTEAARENAVSKKAKRKSPVTKRKSPVAKRKSPVAKRKSPSSGKRKNPSSAQSESPSSEKRKRTIVPTRNRTRKKDVANAAASSARSRTRKRKSPEVQKFSGANLTGSRRLFG